MLKVNVGNSARSSLKKTKPNGHPPHTLCPKKQSKAKQSIHYTEGWALVVDNEF